MNYQIGDYIKASVKNTTNGLGESFTIEGTVIGVKPGKLCLEGFKVLHLDSIEHIQLSENVKSINQSNINRQIAMLRHPSSQNIF
jgi:hypothetical protein